MGNLTVITLVTLLCLQQFMALPTPEDDRFYDRQVNQRTAGSILIDNFRWLFSPIWISETIETHLMQLWHIFCNTFRLFAISFVQYIRDLVQWLSAASAPSSPCSSRNGYNNYVTGDQIPTKRNSELINSLLSIPKTMNDAGK